MPSSIGTSSSLHSDPLPVLKGSVLLLPAPNSIAHLAHLAIDLIIHNALPESSIPICRLHSPFLQPFIGADPFTANCSTMTIATPMELFFSQDAKVAILQIRSSAIAGMGTAFIKDLSQWIVNQQFSKVFMVSGLDSAFIAQDQLLLGHLAFFAASSPSSLQDTTFLSKLESLNISAEKIFEISQSNQLSQSNPLPMTLSPGGGLTNILLKELFNLVPCDCLVWYTSEGDNKESAMEFARAIHHILFENIPKSWSYPSSWNDLSLPPIDLTY